MNRCYDEIMNLKEADEFKNIIKKWEVLSGNIKKYPNNAPIILPDMFWVAKSGVGKTKLLKLMSEYLYSKGNLIDFYGDVKFFEFMLNYTEPNEPFNELRRLMDEINNAAGFRNEYRGIILIDIDDWVNCYEEKHFKSFMEYISSNSDKWLVVLSVSGGDSQQLHNLQAFLSMYLRLEKIILTLPKTEDLFVYIEERLSQYGLSLSGDAQNLLHATIEKLRRNRYFDGFKTIKLLCHDIVYEFYSKENTSVSVLTESDLAAFSADSEYVKRTVAKFEKKNKIGLLNGE